ncbi:MAG: GvpL/GvpF family gas vesicle protein [Solirubrobacterales bacterium]
MADEMSARYVYGVVRAGDRPPSEGLGLGGAPLELVSADGVAALTSEIPGEYLEAGRDELLTHSRVLEEALQRGSVVLPMRFGVVMPDAEAVCEELLDPHRDGLRAQLEEMEGKVEVNLKALHDEQRILAEIVRENPEVAELRAALQGKPQEATYYERIRLGELVAQALDEKRAETAPAIVEALTPYAIAVEVGEPVHERMALNASFLVDRGRLEEFDRAVDEVGEREGGRIRLKYTGPLPPHSFVQLGVGG